MAEGRARLRLVALLLALTVVVLGVDQLTKQLVVSTFTVGEYHPVLGDALGLSLVLNSGAAFSLAEGSTWLFTIAAVVVTVAIIRIARRLGSRGWAVALGALLGGALGNLMDRLFREPGFAVGHVVDFINYNGWFVGNVADIAIVLAAAGIVVLSFRGIGVDGRRVGAQEDAKPEGAHAAEPAGSAGSAPDAVDSDADESASPDLPASPPEADVVTRADG